MMFQELGNTKSQKVPAHVLSSMILGTWKNRPLDCGDFFMNSSIAREGLTSSSRKTSDSEKGWLVGGTFSKPFTSFSFSTKERIWATWLSKNLNSSSERWSLARRATCFKSIELIRFDYTKSVS